MAIGQQDREMIGCSKHTDARKIRSNSFYSRHDSPTSEISNDKRFALLVHHSHSGQQHHPLPCDGSSSASPNQNHGNDARLNRHLSNEPHPNTNDNQYLTRPLLKNSSSGSRFYANKIFASMSNLSVANHSIHGENTACDSGKRSSGKADNDSKGRSDSPSLTKPLPVLQAGACPFVQSKKGNHLLSLSTCTSETSEPARHVEERRNDEDPSFQGQVEIQSSLDSEHSIPVSCHISPRHVNGTTESKLTMFAGTKKLCELYLQHVFVEAIPDRKLLLRITTKSKSPETDEAVYLKCRSNLEFLVWTKALHSWGAEIRNSKGFKSHACKKSQSQKPSQSLKYFVAFILCLAISLPCCRSIMPAGAKYYSVSDEK
eukprot:753396-Hanusia_phi.AAC.3